MLELLRPTVYTACLFEDIDPEKLLEQVSDRTGGRVRGVTFDLDSTMVAQNDTGLSDKNLEVVRGFAELVPIGINSNSGSEERSDRVKAIAGDISEAVSREVIVVTSYDLGSWRCRKPSKQPYDKAAKQMELPNSAVCHIGDQLLKDSWGARRAGYLASVLVKPCARRNDPRGVRFAQRHVETAMLGYMGLWSGTPPYEKMPEASSASYGRSKLICYAGAALLAAGGAAEVIDSQSLGWLASAGFSEAMAVEFLRIGATLRTRQHGQRLEERFASLRR